MIGLERYQELQKDVEKSQRQLDRAEGALEQLKERLADEFDCKGIKEAEKLAADMKKKLATAEKTFTKSLEAFEKEWGTE